MVLEDLIAALSSAKGPDRGLDGRIAQAIGFRKRFEEVSDKTHGGVRRKTIWLVPEGDDVAIIPRYTASVDAAILLAHSIDPDHVAGCSWEKGMGSARMNDGPYHQASSPAIALCIAALTQKVTTDHSSD